MEHTEQDKRIVTDVSFVSTWEEGVIETEAKLDIRTGEVFSIDVVDPGDEFERLIKEEIILRKVDALEAGVDQCLLVEADEHNDYRIVDGESLKALRRFGEAKVAKQSDLAIRALREVCARVAKILRDYASRSVSPDERGESVSGLKLLAQIFKMRSLSDVFTSAFNGGAIEVRPLPWPNGANASAYHALYFLAEHRSPAIGGEERFNSIHLLQIADELDAYVRKMHSVPAYDSRLAAELGAKERPQEISAKEMGLDSMQDRLKAALDPSQESDPFDKAYDTGALDALGSMVLALHSNPEVPKTAIVDALNTTLDAIGNNAPDYRALEASVEDYAARGWLAALSDAFHGGGGATLPHTKEKLSEILQALSTGRLIYAGDGDAERSFEPRRQGPAPRG